MIIAARCQSSGSNVHYDCDLLVAERFGTANIPKDSICREIQIYVHEKQHQLEGVVTDARSGPTRKSMMAT